MAALTKPIDIYSLAGVLGSGSRDVGGLCTASSIKQWNKNKPVDVNTVVELNPDQRKGIPNASGVPAAYNNNNGWFYGLKIATATSPEWRSVHSVINFAYRRPSGGITSSPYRMLDFVGYNHARVSPSTVLTNPFYDVPTIEALMGGTLEIRISGSGNTDTEPSDNDSVDVAWCCATSKTSVFPLAVITDNTAGTCYAVPLIRQGDTCCRPLWYANARQDNWKLNFATAPSGFANLSHSYTMSICLTTKSSGGFNVCDGVIPVWQAVSSLGFVQRLFGVPQGVGRALRFIESDPTPLATITGTPTVLRDNLNVAYTVPSVPTTGTYYARLSISIMDSRQIWRGGGASADSQITSTSGTLFTGLERLLDERPLSATTYSVTINVETGTHDAQGNFVGRKMSSPVTISWTYNP